MWHRLLCTAILSVGIALLGDSASAAPIKLSPEQMRIAANTALQSGDPQAALTLAEALLQRDPNDLKALLLQARAARDLSRFETARTSARRAWSLSATREERYASALVMAQALSSGGHKTRAQLWLRRAAQNAPNAALKALAVRDFGYVRATNPLATHLRFSISPSSNINNGSKSDTLVIGGLAFDLSGDARALSGLEYRFGGDLTWRKRLGADQVLRLGASFDGRSYTLSGAAKAQAPDARAADYRFFDLEFSLGSSKLAPSGQKITDVDLVAGQNWYGGAALTRYLRASFGQRFKISPRTRLNYRLSAERQWRLDKEIHSASVLTLSGGGQQALGRGAQLGWTLGLRNTSSGSATIGHKAVFAGLRYLPRARLAGAKMEWSLDLEKRDYDKRNFGILRQDRRLSAGLTLFFQDVEYFGFAPAITFSASRNSSNISLYENDGFSMNLGLRSAF